VGRGGPLRSAVEARGARDAREAEASSARSASSRSPRRRPAAAPPPPPPAAAGPPPAPAPARAAPPARAPRWRGRRWPALEHRGACSACSQLRPQVVEGAEMVAGHESSCRLAELDAEHAELRMRAAVLEEQAAPPAPTRSASGRRCASGMRCARRRHAWRRRGRQPPARRWRRGRAAVEARAPARLLLAERGGGAELHGKPGCGRCAAAQGGGGAGALMLRKREK
jgi:hypothetical protein